MEKSCKTLVYIHKDFGDLTKEHVPFKFTTKEGTLVEMWKCREDGRWECDCCPGKKKDYSYDPDDTTHRFDSKMCHNRYRDHTRKIHKMWKPPDGYQILEWGLRHEKYKDAMEEYNKADIETRKGDLSTLSFCLGQLCLQIIPHFLILIRLRTDPEYLILLRAEHRAGKHADVYSTIC